MCATFAMESDCLVFVVVLLTDSSKEKCQINCSKTRSDFSTVCFNLMECTQKMVSKIFCLSTAAISGLTGGWEVGAIGEYTLPAFTTG